MVLPLLGLLGAAAGTLAAPSINNFMAKGRGRAFDQSGVDMSSFGEAGVQAQRMGSAGILGGYGSEGNRQLVDQMFGVQEGRADRGNALQRANISAASGIMNANLARDKFNNQLEAQANYGSALVRAGMPEIYKGTPLQDVFAANLGVNSPEFVNAGKTDQTIDREAYTQMAIENLEANQRRAQEAILPSATAATIAQNQEIIDAPQIRQQQAQEAQQVEFEANARPLRAQIDKFQGVLEALPDATRWAGDWFDMPENAQAKADVNQSLMELQQAWVYRLTNNNEPSEAVEKKLAAGFPTDIGMFNSRRELELFIQNEQRELQQEIEREEAAIFNRGQGGASGLYRNPMSGGSGNTINNNNRVTPDG